MSLEDWSGKDDVDPFEVLELDPDGKPLFVVAVGSKGSGKSHFSRGYAQSWPYDALLIDPTGDFDPDLSFSVPYPGSGWPERSGEENEVRRFRLKPDRLDPHHRERSDAALYAAHEHEGPTLMVLDEGRYLVSSEEKILSGTDVVLNEGRHGLDFLFVNNPRAIGIRPVIYHQADLIAVFGPMHEADVDTLAPHMHLSSIELYDRLMNLETKKVPGIEEEPTGFVLADKRRREVFVFPPLP